MPLLLLCGHPCSGKSTRAEEIASHFREKGKEVHLLTEENVLMMAKNECYRDLAREKNTRSGLRAAVERHISKNSLTILDSCNPIKGFRYECYCVARAQNTQHSVMHCDITEDEARERNQKRREASEDKSIDYSDEIFEDLIRRLETPDPQNRWDSPLFYVHKDDPTPFEDIDKALFQEAPRHNPTFATSTAPKTVTNYLHELERVTQEIINMVMDVQNQGIADNVSFPGATEKIQLGARQLKLNELRKVKRTFVKMHQTSEAMLSTVPKIANHFIIHLNGYLS